ncbi:hypothetical protein ABB37_01946 [Leptomonas pyrrhocoris]|uniref:Uncharacterized protein n=1 Tax=Leptomonas pyrrhocoris TaxID=157538 RepID=A0A0M9G6Q5_LEPPY|nr:hypothetical protein ABB37_01946 [Leptomonas pyrrhocoris]KPA83690.1 hypothetical protein ABB37_01946 [Leptomonas pyrrhocoris]|eukprot:XP_015662129.1 hypothetical protein ABB37_01946 [Leptomonas pyrrhocoris]
MMSSDTISVDSGETHSSPIASPVSQDTPTSHRSMRSRLVRVGSADDGGHAPPGLAQRHSSNGSTIGGGSFTQVPPQAQCSSPVHSSPLSASSSGGMPSSLLAPSRNLGEHNGVAPLLQHRQEQQRHQIDENALAGGKAPLTPTILMVSDLKFTREPHGTAPTSNKPVSFFKAAHGDRRRKSLSTPSFVMSGTVAASSSYGCGVNSRPASPLLPVGASGGTVFDFSATPPGGNATAATAAATPAPTAAGKHLSDPAKRPTSPKRATTTAALFPTTEWIRTALASGVGCGSGSPVSGEGEMAPGGDPRGGLALPPSKRDDLAEPPAAGAASLMNGTATPPPPRDAAMRLHEQRVEAAVRSQDEMREFGVILRRLEEEGAQVLRERRRRRHGRRSNQSGGCLDGGFRQRAQNGAASTGGGGLGDTQRQLSLNSDSGAQSSQDAGDNASQAASNYTDADEEDEMTEEGVRGSMHPERTMRDRMLGGKESSARAVAEVQGAENMSHVALIKLRDRSAREWVLLQRRRLEQRRGGSTALQRRMQASQARLQAVRTRGGGGGTGNVETQLQQLLWGNTAHHDDDGDTNVAVTAHEATERETSAFPPGPPTGVSVPPATAGSLPISWGEENASFPVQGGGGDGGDVAADVADGKAGGERADAEERSGPDATNSVASPEAGATHDGHLALHEDDASLVPVDGRDTDGVRTPVDPARALQRELDSEASAVSLGSPSSTHLQRGDAPAVAAGSADVPAPDSTTTTTAVVATATTAATTNPLLEEVRLRRELQRLLFHANECTLYGLDKCLNSRTAAKRSAPQLKHDSPRTASSSPSRRSAAEGRSTTWGAAPHHASKSQQPCQSEWTPSTADYRGPTLPLPLHRTFGTFSSGVAASSLPGSRRRPAGKSHSSTTMTPRAEPAETPRLNETSAAAPHGAEKGATLSLPPLHPSSFEPSSRTSGRPPSNFHPTTSLDMELHSGKRSASSLPSMTASKHAASSGATGQKVSAPPPPTPLPPRRFDSLSKRKRRRHPPLPVVPGVGEHAAALLQHEILLTRRHEMEAEWGNARQVDRACETLQQLFPLREHLLEQEIHKGKATTRSAGQPPLLLMQRGTMQAIPSTEVTALTDASGGTPPRGSGPPLNSDAAVDRSYHPQAILQRHRQLLYDEAVRMESSSRYAARTAYLDVLKQLAQRLVSSVSWPVVERLLADAREQLRPEAEATTPSADGSTGSLHRARASPDRSLASLSPRDKLQQLIAAHLGTLELSQWPVQEVLQHLAALYRVPLYVLHESIAAQQRRFAHTYNYEERFRAVDRALLGSGAGADCVLRLTLHRCRRPPLAPTREGTTASSTSGNAASGPTTATEARPVAAADPRGEALYFIRLRVGLQSVSSSAVPLSSTATGHAAAGSVSLSSLSDRDGTGAGGTAMHGAAQLSGGGAGGGMLSVSSATSSAGKLLSFLGQTLTIYLPSFDAAARRRRAGTGVAGGTRPYKNLASQGTGGSAVVNANTNNDTGGVGEDEGERWGMTVELMQVGVEAPLARGVVDLAAMGFHTYAENGRIHAQRVKIALRRKGYRPAELKATLEVTA